MHVAVQTEEMAAVTWLLQKKSPVNVLDGRNQTPLSYAVRNKNRAIVLKLIEHGADRSMLKVEVDYRDELAKTFELEKAIMKCQFKIALAIILDQDKKYQGQSLYIKSVDKGGNTFVHLLASEFDGSDDAQKCMQALLEKKIDPNHRNQRDCDALDLVDKAHFQLVETILFPEQSLLVRIIDLRIIKAILLKNYIPSQPCPVQCYRSEENYSLEAHRTVSLFAHCLKELFDHIDITLFFRTKNQLYRGLMKLCSTYESRISYHQHDDKPDRPLIASYELTDKETKNFFAMLFNLQQLVRNARSRFTTTGTLERMAPETLTAIKILSPYDGRPTDPPRHNPAPFFNRITRSSSFPNVAHADTATEIYPENTSITLK